MKVFFRNIHLYLSLAAGLVIMSCCFTGAILVFEKELMEAFNHSRYYVPRGEMQLSLSELTTRVKQEYPAAKITGIKVYTDPERSVEISASLPQPIEKNTAHASTRKQDTTGAAISKQNSEASGAKPQKGEAPIGNRTTNYTAFVNPYTGQILEMYTYRETFFYTMFALHRWLLGGADSVGKTITGVATFIFLFILITGIILWWPRNKAILKQRLKIKTNASWKRLNHDLHLVLGFYSAIFLFIFSFTALTWSFKWFNDGIYTVTNSSMKPATPPVSQYQEGAETLNFDSIYIAGTKAIPNTKYLTLRAPADSAAAYTINVLPAGAHESASDNYYFDQYSGQLLSVAPFSERNLGQRVRAGFKPVHTGSIYGWPSKIIAFLACVAGVTFPVTGTIMWLKRLQKNRKRKRAGVPIPVEEEEYQ